MPYKLALEWLKAIDADTLRPDLFAEVVAARDQALARTDDAVAAFHADV